LPAFLSRRAALAAAPHTFSGGAAAQTLEVAKTTPTIGASIKRLINT
jgi:hypothetical protein